MSKEDVDAINNGINTPIEVIERKLFKELKQTNLENIIIRKRLEVLAWLVAKGKMEIKIALPVNNGKISSNKIWHSKFAIFEDFYGNKVHIEGSINETAEGWIQNAESFSVHRSWILQEKDYIISAEREFIKTWNNENLKVKTYTIPEAVKREFIKLAPNEIMDIYDPEEIIKYKKLKLWPHQEKAIRSWFENNRKGILSMATGSGKTYTALFAVKNIPSDSFIVVVVPTKELISQWKKEIEKIFGNVPIIMCYSSNNRWKEMLPNFILGYKNRQGKKFILTTIRTAQTDTFLSTINDVLGEEFVLIVDEVHRIGAPKSRKILQSLNPSLGRLGLSATPIRIWDKEGTGIILNYFGGIIYEYSLKDAINDGRIVPYEYHIEIVNLTREELENYIYISRKISKIYANIIKKYNIKNVSLQYILENNDKIKEASILQQLLVRRSQIIKKAQNKISKTIEIIEKNKEKLGRCLIYCQDKQQLENLAKELDKRGYLYVKYLGTFDDKVRLTHLDLLSKGIARFLLAIKCLDEGIDIPVVDSAIILSSSTNPREFIQRRGRILRKAPGKKKAYIYDLFVLPFIDNYHPISKFEAEIIKRELERSIIFLENALDSEDSFIKVMEIYNRIKNNLGE